MNFLIGDCVEGVAVNQLPVNWSCLTWAVKVAGTILVRILTSKVSVIFILKFIERNA